jgi:hypothetical protein
MLLKAVHIYGVTTVVICSKLRIAVHCLRGYYKLVLHAVQFIVGKSLWFTIPAFHIFVVSAHWSSLFGICCCLSQDECMERVLRVQGSRHSQLNAVQHYSTAAYSFVLLNWFNIHVLLYFFSCICLLVHLFVIFHFCFVLLFLFSLFFFLIGGEC